MSYRIAIRALGPIIFAYVLWQVDWQHVGVILHKAGTRCFVLAGLLLVPQMVIKALRWMYLLGILGEQVSPYQAVATYFASLLLGILTPGRLGEFTKVYYLHRSIGTDLGRGLSSALADRLYDLAILVAVAIAGLVWLHPPLGIVLSLVVLGVGILATILWRRRSKILNNVETRLKAVLPGDLLDRTGGIGAAVVKDLQRHPAWSTVLHVDLQRIVADEKIRINVPLNFLNESTAVGVKLGGGTVSHMQTEVAVSCLPKDLPEHLAVDIEDLDLDQMLYLSDIKLHDGVELTDLTAEQPRNDPIVAVHILRIAEEPEEVEGEELEGEELEAVEGEEAAAEEGAAPAEGESGDKAEPGDKGRKGDKGDKGRKGRKG